MTIRRSDSELALDFGLSLPRVGSRIDLAGDAELTLVEPGLRGVFAGFAGAGKPSEIIRREGQHSYRYRAQ